MNWVNWFTVGHLPVFMFTLMMVLGESVNPAREFVDRLHVDGLTQEEEFQSNDLGLTDWGSEPNWFGQLLGLFVRKKHSRQFQHLSNDVALKK